MWRSYLIHFAVFAIALVATACFFFRHLLSSDRKVRGVGVQTKILDSPKMKTARLSEGFSFAGYPLGFDDARQHFCIVGSTGSGKTCLMRLLMQSVCYRMAKGPEQVRMLAYDAKTDLISKLAGMDEVTPEQIIVMNPLDARSSAWDLAADITSSYYAQEFADSLIPYDREKGGENAHFFITAQIFLNGIIDAFNYHASGKWTLRDILNVSRDTERLKALFASCPNTIELIAQHFAVEKTALSVKATMDSYLRPFRPIAAAWHKAERERPAISVRSWLNSSGKILLLGNNPKAKAGIQSLNRMFFAEASKAIRSIPGEATDQQSWIFLDELSELGELPTLKDLLITGRSKGAAVCLGFQDILGIDAVYGKEVARELIGQTQNGAFLHINPFAVETQRWASDCIGKWEFKRTERGHSTTEGGGESHSYNERYHIEDRWLPSQFETDLPSTDGTNGLHGLFKIRRGQIAPGYPEVVHTWFRQHIKSSMLFGTEGDLSRLRPKHAEIPDYIERPDEHMDLIDWNSDDYARLGIASLWQVRKPPSAGAPDSTDAPPDAYPTL